MTSVQISSAWGRLNRAPSRAQTFEEPSVSLNSPHSQRCLPIPLPLWRVVASLVPSVSGRSPASPLHLGITLARPGKGPDNMAKEEKNFMVVSNVADLAL